MLVDGSLDHLAFSLCLNLELDVTALVGVLVAWDLAKRVKTTG